MMRHATTTDFDFINLLVLSEAHKGHFDRKLLIPAAMRGWELELRSVLVNRVRLNGLQSYALIWEQKKKAVGFVIMSAGPDNRGNELWMAAVSPEHRGIGEGKKMILEILKQFKGHNRILMARCAPESQAMFHILTTNGFMSVTTGEQGSRGLIYSF
jgi:ribosomal protein S18 acetylase RimI-like enzyme